MIYYNSARNYLEKLESTLSDDNVLMAEDAYNKMGFEFVSLYQKLWILKVTDTKDHEVEILLKSKKLENHTCDCGKYKENTVCEHILASYLWIRNYVREQISKKEEAKKLKEKKTEYRQSINTVSSILKNARPHDVSNFLLNYARKDKKLSTAIKVHFLSKGGNSSRQNVRSILDSIAPPITTKDKKLHNSSWLLLFRTLEDFASQTADFLSLNNFRQASNILIESLIKLYYLSSKYPEKEEKLNAFLEIFTVKTKELFDAIEAPIQKDEMKKTFQSLLQKSYYGPFISEDICHILLDNNLFDVAELEDILESYQIKDSMLSRQIIHSISFSLRIKSAQKRLEDIDILEISKKYFSQIVNEIISEEDYECLSRIVAILESNNKIQEYGKYKLILLKSKQDLEAYKDLALELFAVTENYIYFKKYDEVCQNHQVRSISKKVKDYLSEMSISAQLEFWNMQDNEKELIANLGQVEDIEVFLEYAKIVSEDQNEILLPMYLKHIDYFINNFIGSSIEKFLINLNQHLEIHKTRKMKRKIIDYIKENYSYRDSIANYFKY